MPMPETAMNEDRLLGAPEHDVRTSGEIPRMQSVSCPEPPKDAPDD